MTAQREKPSFPYDDNLRIDIDNLNRLVSQLIAANGHLKPAEIEILRKMLEERKFSTANRRNIRIWTGYFAAAAIFFYTIREYVGAFWASLKTVLK